ncbi:MAG: hypothetical protein QM478_11730 [Flavobacteriaceae bacterium]
MKKEKEIIEKIAAPLFIPSITDGSYDPINDESWCYFVFYSDRSTGLEYSEPTKEEKIEALDSFFLNLKRNRK